MLLTLLNAKMSKEQNICEAGIQACICACLCVFGGNWACAVSIWNTEEGRAQGTRQRERGGEKKSSKKWDDCRRSHLEVFEGVLGFRPECCGDGVCLPACVADRSRWRTWNWTAIFDSHSHPNKPDVTHTNRPVSSFFFFFLKVEFQG